MTVATSPESLLDTYHAERHPAAARTLALGVLQRRDDRMEALVDLVSELATAAWTSLHGRTGSR